MSARLASRFRLLVAAVAGFALFASAGTARADMVNIGESTLPGIFTGTVSVTNQTTTSAVITVTLNNISPAANGGYITGLAFNDPFPNSSTKPNISSVTGFSTSFVPAAGQSFGLIGGPSYTNTISTSPYGFFDIGAAVGSSWLGNGSPTAGIAVGQTGTFVFTVTGTNMSTLTAQMLLNAMSSNGTAGFAVRFRGFADGSSDKDIAGVICPPPPPPPSGVPAPPGLVLAGMGLGGLLLGRLRFRRSPTVSA